MAKPFSALHCSRCGARPLAGLVALALVVCTATWLFARPYTSVLHWTSDATDDFKRFVTIDDAPANLNDTDCPGTLKDGAAPSATAGSKPTAPAPDPCWFRVGLVTMLRNKSDRILEWVAFHRLQGVTDFYVVDDGSTDGLESMLRPLVELGVLRLWTLAELDPANPSFRSAQLYSRDADACAVFDELQDCFDRMRAEAGSLRTSWTAYACQRAAFRHGVATARHTGLRWLGICDVDEFFFTPSTGTFLTLAHYLHARPSEIARATISPLSFGPLTGHETSATPFLVTEQLVRCPRLVSNRDGRLSAAQPWTLWHKLERDCIFEPGSCYKTFVRPEVAIMSTVNIHMTSVRGKGENLAGYLDASPVRFHHYKFDNFTTMRTKVEMYSDKSQICYYHILYDTAIQDYYTMAENRAATAFLPDVHFCMASVHFDSTRCSRPFVVDSEAAGCRHRTT